ncbi:unnamed protein product [Arabis nemorensis]|uniref:Uncharacterized protein n=1 Tax=Arabis nemorensis TaxID=586526 RepID=A0A565C6P9_9BRAS|nr:unnamed protein product [Arabis nemorensis]
MYLMTEEDYEGESESKIGNEKKKRKKLEAEIPVHSSKKPSDTVTKENAETSESNITTMVVSFDVRIAGRTVICSKYILRRLLPHMKEIYDEQIAEKEIEAKILGLEFGERHLQEIFDFHRSCSGCSFDICLTCCLKIRSGKLQACQENVSWSYMNRGLEYAHGGTSKFVETANNKLNREDRVKLSSMWKAKENGSISCYCGAGDMKLKRILRSDWVSDILKKVGKTAEATKLLDLPETVMGQCPCFNSEGHIDMANYKFKTACRDASEDNYLYCPSVSDVRQYDLKHFQHHWVKGEPVVVRNVLEATPGLSWEPMVMYRACRQRSHTKHETLVVDCLDFCEVRSYSLDSMFIFIRSVSFLI